MSTNVLTKFTPKNQEQGNSATSREIKLKTTDMQEAHINMVQISNVERKPFEELQLIPLVHDLLDLVMDSVVTCHMTLIKWFF